MATLTLTVPEELKQDVDAEPLVNWSAVARAAIHERVSQLKLFKSIVSRSRLTEKDALELGKKINRSMHERFVEEHPEAYR